jgi:hypothetical protein
VAGGTSLSFAPLLRFSLRVSLRNFNTKTKFRFCRVVGGRSG